MHSQHFWVSRFIAWRTSFRCLRMRVGAYVCVCVCVDSKLEGRPSRRNKIDKIKCMQGSDYYVRILREGCRRNAERRRRSSKRIERMHKDDVMQTARCDGSVRAKRDGTNDVNLSHSTTVVQLFLCVRWSQRKLMQTKRKKNNWSQLIHIRLVFVCAFSPFDIKWQYAAARRHIQTLMDGNGNWKEIERGIFNASGAAQFRIIPDSSEHCSFESPLKFHGCRRKNAFAGAQTPHRHLSFRALFPFSLFVCESVWLTQLSHEPHSIQLVRWTSKARKECTTFTCRRFEIRARQWDTPSSLSSLIWSN